MDTYVFELELDVKQQLTIESYDIGRRHHYHANFHPMRG